MSLKIVILDTRRVETCIFGGVGCYVFDFFGGGYFSIFVVVVVLLIVSFCFLFLFFVFVVLLVLVFVFCLFIIIIIIYSLSVFPISFSWWFFTGVWVTASLLKSLGLFSIFWPFSIMLLWGWSPIVCQLPSPPVPSMILKSLFQKHQLQLLQLSLACSIVFHFPCKVNVHILLFIFFQFYSVVSRDSKVDNFAISLFLLLIIIRSGLMAEIRGSVCMSKSQI